MLCASRAQTMAACRSAARTIVEPASGEPSRSDVVGKRQNALVRPEAPDLRHHRGAGQRRDGNRGSERRSIVGRYEALTKRLRSARPWLARSRIQVE